MITTSPCWPKNNNMTWHWRSLFLSVLVGLVLDGIDDDARPCDDLQRPRSRVTVQPHHAQQRATDAQPQPHTNTHTHSHVRTSGLLIAAKDVLAFHSGPRGVRSDRSYCSRDVNGYGMVSAWYFTNFLSRFSLMMTVARPASLRLASLAARAFSASSSGLRDSASTPRFLPLPFSRAAFFAAAASTAAFTWSAPCSNGNQRQVTRQHTGSHIVGMSPKPISHAAMQHCMQSTVVGGRTRPAQEPQPCSTGCDLGASRSSRSSFSF